MELYHGTSLDRLPSIIEFGLDPAKSECGSARVYLSHDAAHAEVYGADRSDKHILLKVNTADIDQKLLMPDDCDYPSIIDDMDDDCEYDPHSWQDSLICSGQCAYDGVLKPEWIMVSFDAGMTFIPLDQANEET